MNCDEMYLIHEGDYLDHITDKVSLYIMLKNLTGQIRQLPPDRVSKELAGSARLIGNIADSLFHSWGIPERFLRTATLEDLGELMESELLMPEDAGYVLVEEDDEDEDEDFCEDDSPDEAPEGLDAILEFIKNVCGENRRITLTVSIE